MANEKSCIGCKFMYTRDTGYSNYTVLGTDVDCVLNKNPNLPAEEPYDWNRQEDNWPVTQESRCELYKAGDSVHFDCDGEDTLESLTDDPELLAAFAPTSNSEHS